MFYLQKYVPKETKDINVKGFHMITNKNGAKTMTKHISEDCKCKFNRTTCNSNQKRNTKTCQCEYKNYHKCKKIKIQILAHAFVRKVFLMILRLHLMKLYLLRILYQQK